MKLKVIRVLALVLNAGLSGCSTAPSLPPSSSSAGNVPDKDPARQISPIDWNHTEPDGKLTLVATGQTSSLDWSRTDQDLTKKISAILLECQQIKPGMTRAELLKVFATEGGLSTALHQTYVDRACPYVKVDVDFILSAPGQNALEERPTDTISKISKPYLEWTNAD